MKKKAFTLIELVAAVGMLAMIIAFTSIIFRFGIDAHRISVANAEIMQKARAITEQLNADFGGLRKDAPLLIWFKQDDPSALGPDEVPNRYDQMMFFASGDFSSLQLYRDDGTVSEPLRKDDTIDNQAKIIRGNLARIQYAHATRTGGADIEDIKPIDRILSRRTHILYSNPKIGLELKGWPDFNNLDRDTEDYYEHDTLIMADWKHPKNAGSSNVENIYENEIIPKVFVDYHPKIDKTNADTLHLLMCEKVSSFAVQFAYWGKNTPIGGDWKLRWFPSNNPNGDTFSTDTHFNIGGIDNEFGVFFNIPDINDITTIDWYRIDQLIDYGKNEWKDDPNPNANEKIKADNYPVALKFTFTIYDRNNFIKGGRTFTHIVYLED